MSQAEHLLDLINKDLQLFDEGETDPERFWVLVAHPELGTIVPLNWLDRYAELGTPWAMYMNGKTYCPAGYYVTDVRSFLSSKIGPKA